MAREWGILKGEILEPEIFERERERERACWMSVAEIVQSPGKRDEMSAQRQEPPWLSQDHPGSPANN